MQKNPVNQLLEIIVGKLFDASMPVLHSYALGYIGGSVIFMFAVRGMRPPIKFGYQFLIEFFLAFLVQVLWHEIGIAAVTGEFDFLRAVFLYSFFSILQLVGLLIVSGGVEHMDHSLSLFIWVPTSLYWAFFYQWLEKLAVRKMKEAHDGKS